LRKDGFFMSPHPNLGRPFSQYLNDTHVYINPHPADISLPFSQPRPAMAFLVFGSHTFPNESLVRRTIRFVIQPADTVLHGGVRRVDTWCADEAQRLGATALRCPAPWQMHGQSAGWQRQTAMLDALVEQADPYHIFLFWDGESRETARLWSFVLDRALPHTVILSDETIHAHDGR